LIVTEHHIFHVPLAVWGLERNNDPSVVTDAGFDAFGVSQREYINWRSVFGSTEGFARNL
jgi:hypothetical protein